jgi:hypothetical protein
VPAALQVRHDRGDRLAQVALQLFDLTPQQRYFGSFGRLKEFRFGQTILTLLEEKESSMVRKLGLLLWI